MSPTQNYFYKMYELPDSINMELCRLLDHDNIWRKVAGRINYSSFELNELERCKSPSAVLLSRLAKESYIVDQFAFDLYHIDSNPYMPAINCLNNYLSKKFKKWQDRKKLNVLNLSSQETVPSGVLAIEQSTSMTRELRCTNSIEHRKLSQPIDNKEIEKMIAIPSIDYEVLKKATDNWDQENFLGGGGFGQVFKGLWNYLPVAVKRLTKNHDNKELIREMCLNQYRHDNILPLYGYSLGGPETLLVYQLIMGGSLQEQLRCKAGRPPLTWPQRHKIAHGVARGLLFLHTMSYAPLIHGDIKPANILLDQCCTPKIGDFGLARKGLSHDENTHLKVSTAAGTRAYLPDDYLKSRCLSTAVDVFSFGVVMMEMATGLPAVAEKQGRLHVFVHKEYLNKKKNISDLVSLEDKTIPESNPKLCEEFLKIGLNCTKADNRPSMQKVFELLNE